MKPSWLLFTLACALLVILSLSAPILEHVGDATDAGYNYGMFSGFCHQIRERSLTLFGEPLAVCARCFGIYLGLLIGSLSYPLRPRRDRTPTRWLLILAITPLAVDGLTQLISLRESSNSLRLLTGLLFGAVMPYYIIPALNELWGAVFIRQLR